MQRPGGAVGQALALRVRGVVNRLAGLAIHAGDAMVSATDPQPPDLVLGKGADTAGGSGDVATGAMGEEGKGLAQRIEAGGTGIGSQPELPGTVLEQRVDLALDTLRSARGGWLTLALLGTLISLGMLAPRNRAAAQSPSGHSKGAGCNSSRS